MHHYETREAMHQGGVDPTDILLDGLSTEQIAALDKRARQTEQEKVDILIMGEDLLTFRELHPDYIDEGPIGHTNMLAMVDFFAARGISHPTLVQLEDAYENLTARSRLQLDQAALQGQVKKRHQKRAGEIEARGGVAAVAANTPTESEEELYEMPLAEIRRRATPGGWLR
jgi:hypothetical protein